MPYSRELFEKRSTTAIITRHAACCVTPQLPAYLLAGVHICHIGQVLTEVSRELCEFRMAVAVAQRVVPVCRPARRALRMYFHCTVHVPQLADAPRVLRIMFGLFVCYTTGEPYKYLTSRVQRQCL